MPRTSNIWKRQGSASDSSRTLWDLRSWRSGSRAADLSREGLDEMQGTRTLRQAHTKAPAVAAMARTSLRLGAFFVFLRRSGCGCTSAPEGGEMS